MAISNLVSDSVKYVNRETSTFATVPAFAHESTKKSHLLVINKTLRLAVWTVSGKGYLQEAFQRQLPNLFSVYDDQVQNQITIRPGPSGLAGVMKKKADPFQYDINQVVNHLSFLFHAGLEYWKIGCHRSAISVYHEYTDGISTQKYVTY